MAAVHNKDTRYFIDIGLSNQQIIHHGYAQKQTLDKGRQNDEKVHRVFLTQGQYNKLVSRAQLS